MRIGSTDVALPEDRSPKTPIDGEHEAFRNPCLRRGAPNQARQLVLCPANNWH